MNKILFLLILIIFLFPPNVIAIYDPSSTANNHFGIHVADSFDIPETKELINSSGGDWGYVTMVIPENERDLTKWQLVFDRMRELHLIPIIRIASKFNAASNYWEKPKIEDIDNWVIFLNSLNWVIKNRYVVIYNEPNHAKEWGGEINPNEYFQFLKLFYSQLKTASPDFFILPAGLDSSATTTKETLDEKIFLETIVKNNSNLFNYIDGWTSHSYPNPDFSGLPSATGRRSIRSYLWELNLINSLGNKKNLPIFITETGWAINPRKKLDETKIASYFENAYKNAWINPQLFAVTPFIFKYYDPPFDIFSWKKRDGTFYQYYQAFKNLTKIKGEPIQITSGEITAKFITPFIYFNGRFYGIVILKNTGQSIWKSQNLTLDQQKNYLIYFKSSSETVRPGESTTIIFDGLAPKDWGKLNISFNFYYKGELLPGTYPLELKIRNYQNFLQLFDSLKSRLDRIFLKQQANFDKI